MKTFMPLALLAVGSSLPLSAGANTGWVEMSGDYQHYSKGFDSAQTLSLAASLKQSSRTIYGEISDYQRGDVRDLPIQVGAYQAITGTGSLHVEGTWTANPLLKPKHQEYVGWYQALPQGWTIEPGYQWTQYNSVSVEKASIVVEKYWQAYRFVYGAGRVSLAGEQAFNHRLRADWFYHEQDKLSAGIALGDDQEVLPSGLVIQTPVRNYFIAGAHSLSPEWQLLWQLQQTDQGDIYRQQGARLGIRYQY